MIESRDKPKDEFHRYVGPVLQSGPVSDAVIAAIQSLNPKVFLVSRGSYIRVLAFPICRVTRSAIESELSKPFLFPSDLEAIMPSFKGILRLNSDEAVWTPSETRDKE